MGTKIGSQTAPNAAVTAIPWFVWLSVIAISSVVIGIQWDIAWHRSIGRDGLFSPPHVAIYFGGVLAGLTCGYLILFTTFAKSGSARAASVRIWGFRGPLGAFITAWGGIAMISSAPFDDWWHNTYGLDVRILSPPHTVLALGIFALQIGALILISGLMNRATGRTRRALTWSFLYVGGFLLVALLTFEMELTNRGMQHSGAFYRAVASTVPIFLIAIGRASGHRFGTTAAAGIYTSLLLLLLWLFPLVPATPKLGPVYYQVTHLVPGGFPLLLLAPALAIDLVSPSLFQRFHSAWLQSLVLGVLFLGVFMAVQWPFADFLTTPLAHNWVFGSHYFSYNSRHAGHGAGSTPLVNRDGTPFAFYIQLALALVGGLLATRGGLVFGNFLQKLRR
jgi:hypothetical protein